jgi:hypothetical protein
MTTMASNADKFVAEAEEYRADATSGGRSSGTGVAVAEAGVILDAPRTR